LHGSGGDGWIVELSAHNGDLIQDWLIGGIEHNGSPKITSLAPLWINGYIVSQPRDTLFVPGWDRFVSSIARYDLSMQKVWQVFFPHPKAKNIWHFRVMPDSTIWVVGDMADPDYNDTGWIAQLDLDGNLLWERTYRYPGSGYNILHDLLPLPGGGALLTGVCSGSVGNSDVWVLKVDAQGCIVPGCGFVGLPAPQASLPLQVHPNPSSGRFQVEVPESWVAGAVTVQLFDPQGRLLRQTNQLSHPGQPMRLDYSELPGGCYLLRLRHANGDLAQERVGVY
jgi:hypothetical protein